MQAHAHQQGIGLIEVMVAVTLLSIAVLGYGALQLRAMHASQQAMQNIQAMNLARDLAERMRVNRAGFGFYQSHAQTNKVCGTTSARETVQARSFCSAQDMAQYDMQQVSLKAQDLGMQLAVLDCPNIQLKRQCIYVAWGETRPSNGDQPTDCTQGAAYVMRSTCIFMEAYHHAN